MAQNKPIKENFSANTAELNFEADIMFPSMGVGVLISKS